VIENYRLAQMTVTMANLTPTTGTRGEQNIDTPSIFYTKNKWDKTIYFRRFSIGST